MNKWLIRQIRPLTKRLTPQWAGSLVRMIESRTRGKTKEEALVNIAKLLEETITGLKRRGMAADAIAMRIDTIATVAALWIDLTFALLVASFSPAILLALCLASPLDNNLLPERRDFTFEEIKQNLLDRHWPPQRQRCDFIADSAY